MLDQSGRSSTLGANFRTQSNRNAVIGGRVFAWESRSGDREFENTREEISLLAVSVVVVAVAIRSLKGSLFWLFFFLSFGIVVSRVFLSSSANKEDLRMAWITNRTPGHKLVISFVAWVRVLLHQPLLRRVLSTTKSSDEG